MTEPLVSVIVVAHGRPDLLVDTLASLRRTMTSPYELIVVDNPTDAGPTPMPELVEGSTVVRNEINVGFGAAVDQAALVAAGRYLLLLNPDIELPHGWLAPLLQHIDAAPDVVAVSPRLVDPDGTTQEIGSVVGPAGETLALGRGPAAPLAHDPVVRPVDYASAACLLVETDAFLAEGGFDASYGAGYFEDVDLAYRFARAGWRIEVVPEVAVVHHRHGTTDDERAARLMDERRAGFVEAWRPELTGRPSLTDVVSRPHRLRSAREIRRPDRLLVLGQGSRLLPALARGLADARPDLAVTLVHDGPGGIGGPRVEEVAIAELTAGWFAAQRLVYTAVIASRSVPVEVLDQVDVVIDPAVRIVHDGGALFDVQGAGSLRVPTQEPTERWYDALAVMVGLAPRDDTRPGPTGRLRHR
ncbi:MAG: glycosyltransferase family 2 protein [Actinomycetota bacterium]